MLILGIAVAVIAAVLVAAGGIYWLTRLMNKKETTDLNHYLQGENCHWEKVDGPALAEGADNNVYFVNHASASQGIEMRVYTYAESAESLPSDDEGVCLSIIDRANRNGMILNGFALHLEALQFGDVIWNDRFFGDTRVMERMITEKRAAWDQMQREIIVGHYALFM